MVDYDNSTILFDLLLFRCRKGLARRMVKILRFVEVTKPHLIRDQKSVKLRPPANSENQYQRISGTEKERECVCVRERERKKIKFQCCCKIVV
jgi:hypothetical protein